VITLFNRTLFYRLRTERMDDESSDSGTEVDPRPSHINTITGKVTFVSCFSVHVFVSFKYKVFWFIVGQSTRKGFHWPLYRIYILCLERTWTCVDGFNRFAFQFVG